MIEERNRSMDELNHAIIGRLTANARATFAEIGSAVGLSAPAVKRRVDGMVARGEIAGFTTVLDPAALGRDTEAFVEVTWAENVSKKRIRTDLEKIPEVVGVWTVAGEADALVHVIAAGIAEVEATVERLRGNEGIARTRTSIVMSRLLQRPRA
jgi:DNA-binding Lrp family transcriptional regulator